MDFSDIPDAVAQKSPNDVVTLLCEPFHMQDMLVKRIELRLYKITRECRPYYVIVAYLEMDGHTVQMTYDEGYWKDNPLQRVADFVISQLGISSIIIRARIVLDTYLDE